MGGGGGGLQFLQKVLEDKLANVSDSAYPVMGAQGKVQQRHGTLCLGGGGGLLVISRCGRS